MYTVATVESPVLKPMDIVNHSSSGELGLMQASKFGFMIETCILAARNDECLVCPAHKEHPLTIRDIAPDLVRSLNLLRHCTLYIVDMHKDKDLSKFLHVCSIFKH